MTIIKHWFTAADNQTYSLSKLLALSAVVAMIYNFVSLSSSAYVEFGLGISVILAALAGKYFIERGNTNASQDQKD